MNHIIAISTRVSIEYINIGDIKELAAGKDTASAPPTVIIWDEGLRVEGCNESFMGRGGVSTSLCEAPLDSFFNSNS